MENGIEFQPDRAAVVPERYQQRIALRTDTSYLFYQHHLRVQYKAVGRVKMRMQKERRFTVDLPAAPLGLQLESCMYEVPNPVWLCLIGFLLFSRIRF